MWVPSPLIFNIKSVERVQGVRDESTLFILNKRGKSCFEVMYIILAEISFLCPMRYNLTFMEVWRIQAAWFV